MSPPDNEKAAPAKDGSLKTDGNQTLPQPETIDEFSWRHSVTRRTVHRWIKAGKLVVTRTLGGHPRIVGIKE